MKLLMDSHVIVWWTLYPGRLRPETRRLLLAPTTRLTISAVSVWELGIKIALAKLTFPPDWTDRLQTNGVNLLPISIEHAHAAPQLPPIHRDPFDRMLVAQARLEGFTLLTADRLIPSYDVPCLAP